MPPHQKKRDHYDVLGIKRGASPDDVRRAYRNLARKHHPDVSDSEDAAERFAEISEAYEVLSDEKKRAAYDRFGHAGVAGAAGPGPGAAPGGAGFGWPPGSAGAPDLGSIFEEMFAGGRSPFGAGVGGGPHAGVRPVPGQDVHHRITVSFLTAVRGGVERIRLVEGSGAARSFDVRIPAGIEAGGKLRVKGKGHTGVGGAPPGDLIVSVEVGKHPYYRREHLDLLMDVPITVTEAAFGAKVHVPLLDGASAEIKIPPGTASGQKLRLKGRGVRDSQGRTGHFHAVVQIVAPEPMNDRVRGLLEELRAELKNPRESAPWSDDPKESGA